MIMVNLVIVLRGWDKLFAIISNNKLAFYKDQKHYKTVCVTKLFFFVHHVIGLSESILSVVQVSVSRKICHSILGGNGRGIIRLQ